ncbi:MAG: PQQ-binding-like beta-propeller repeat protein [Steroidobacteraceae bacterium]
MSQPIFIVRTLALLACTVSSICGAQETSPGSQWLSYNNHLDGQRYSPLKEITPANATQLGEVCRVQIDGPTSLHSDLIVVDGVIFTGTGRETVALNATTCAPLWRFSYTPDDDRNSPSTRGVAVMNGRVFRGTGDDRLIALDAATGKLLWKTIIGTPALGESSAAAPLAWGGVVYMGISGSELGARGRVMAFDALTGRELWRFNTIPMGKEVGANTWLRPGTAKTGGGGVWGAMTLDVAAGELFVPVGNPWPDIDKAYRPGANLFTDSIVVLDARTGALKWWHQATPEDWMDLDMVAPPVVYRIAGGRDYLVFGGKDGYVTAVDRDTHEQLFRVPVTTIQRMPKLPTKEGMRMCPGYAGGVEWNGPAFDRLNHSLVTGAVDACFIVKLGKASYAPAGMNFGGSVEPVGPTTGWITSIDQVTGAVRWKYHAEKPVVAGITPTAGGVTFAGDLGGHLLVFDSRTGAVVNKIQTGGSLAGGLVTYEAGGHQYVAFADGNVSRNAFGALGLPSVVIMALNPKTLAAGSVAGGPAAAPGVAAGRRLYSQVCVACHGPDGNLVPDHSLSAAVARMGKPATIAYIRSPKLPMPKMYPDLLNDQSISDVTDYLYEQWGHHD